MHAVSVLAIHGLDDRNVPFAGGAGTKGVTPGAWQPVPLTLDLLRTADACGPAAVLVEGPLETDSAACAQGRDLVLIKIAGAGHQWPGSTRKGLLQHVLGGDAPSTALDATARLWEFFRAHPAPP
jgi:polyhydroxybutyrate depolymerase